jgi:predicted AAA+ superfamily ATPase
MPGRKGRLDRTTYLFAPISFAEFRRRCGAVLGADALDAYLLTGGSPIACAHIAQGRLPEYAVELVKDWIYGASAATGRARASLLAVMECLVRYGGAPLGQAKLAREAGLANNTVAAGYVELLTDLTCVASSLAWDASRRIRLRRKPCKFHFCNTLAALAWHPGMVRTVQGFRALPTGVRAAWYEWAVSQELWRRAAIRGDEMPEEQSYWRSRDHELDFVLGPDEFLEVKLGPTNPMEFAWFSHVFPKGRLTVVSQSTYETRNIRGIRLEDFLAE